MKKEIKKLSLGKKTISNLKPTEMNKMVGAGHGNNGSHSYCGCGGTKDGNTCPGHASCYTC